MCYQDRRKQSQNKNPPQGGKNSSLAADCASLNSLDGVENFAGKPIDSRSFDAANT